MKEKIKRLGAEMGVINDAYLQQSWTIARVDDYLISIVVVGGMQQRMLLRNITFELCRSAC